MSPCWPRRRLVSISRVTRMGQQEEPFVPLGPDTSTDKTKGLHKQHITLQPDATRRLSDTIASLDAKIYALAALFVRIRWKKRVGPLKKVY